MRPDSWAATYEGLRACAEREAHLQRQENDQHPAKRIVQVDPELLLRVCRVVDAAGAAHGSSDVRDWRALGSALDDLKEPRT